MVYPLIPLRIFKCTLTNLLTFTNQRLIGFVILALGWSFLYPVASRTFSTIGSHFVDTIPFQYMFACAFWGILLAARPKPASRRKLWETACFPITGLFRLLLFTTRWEEYLPFYNYWLPWIWVLTLYLFAQHRIGLLEHRIMVMGGTISYGIYLMHPWISYPVRWLFQKALFLSQYSWMTYLLVLFLLTYLLAWFIYRYYEHPLRIRFVNRT